MPGKETEMRKELTDKKYRGQRRLAAAADDMFMVIMGSLCFALMGALVKLGFILGQFI